MKPANPNRRKTDIPIPEPRHRVGPKGVSSGISFRNLPPPSLDEIKKICEHYQEKCSGTYKSLASRYVYQMATEIEDLVDVMKGDCSGSETSYPSYHSRDDKENARAGVYGRTAKKSSSSKPGPCSSRYSPESSRRSSMSSKSDRNSCRRNASKRNSRQPRDVTNEKERRRWRKEFQSAHPEVVYDATEKDRRRMKGHRYYDESMCSSASSFSDEESNGLHSVSPTKLKPGRKLHNDDILRWLMEEGQRPEGLEGRQHDEVLKWLKEEMDRSQYLIRRSKQKHDKELDDAKKELEKVKKAAKIVIKAVHKKGKDKAAKLEANVQSERRQRVKSQKMVETLMKSQSEHLDKLKRVNDPSYEMFNPWGCGSGDIFGLIGDSDLTSVLDELAEEALQQSFCS